MSFEEWYEEQLKFLDYIEERLRLAEEELREAREELRQEA
jgi:hypothetical protein